MSLSLNFPTYNGIIMTADRRITTTLNSVDPNQSFLFSDNENKLFLLKNGFGLNYTGTSSVNNIPISSIINDLVNKIDVLKFSPKELLSFIADHINTLNNNGNTILTLSGFLNEEPFICSINTKFYEFQYLYNKDMPMTLSFSGETDMIISLLNDPKYKYDYSKFNLQDAIDFLTLINNTVADFQHFQQRLQTVSHDCDVLAITKYSSNWVRHMSLH